MKRHRPSTKKTNASLLKIALTTGDRDGIGFEVTAKALSKIKPSLKKNRCLFFIFRHRDQQKWQPQYFKLIDKSWLRLTFHSLEQALDFLDLVEGKLPDNLLVDLALTSHEAQWVLDASKACRDGNLDSLVTGPLSKSVTAKLPRKPLGHTGIFRDLFKKNQMFMAFVGRDFNVLLATDHIPFSKVEASLNAKTFSSALKAAEDLRQLLNSKKNLAVLGLNPHSGEKGLLGKIETRLFKKLPKNVDGPLVPDAAFLKKNWSRYSVFVCLYHDQGLIPFKMHHGQDSGVHLTMGLPFVRTSVDHGTAVELFNKNLANSASMSEAIQLNMKLIGAKNV
ncbi:4-hydroxythreonine-4-phosphate dehydrogenase PdxA [Pseudobdellovibrio exovorus]|uniref:Pyridoxal phosphate biosynthetic protein n=1 Tax=Pseudobdellovibrio exovorus JSS TaxID=1184267 RepID=M4V4H4_9BACT|nr:4-hydroxythreonine-4-phosphate dehydrogenase PdxA [Pseudobdellovibrio exovorus]AGH94232.1 pyridoxal phosphate biosynthetic protein [Pseudobdellovibrio exovorus JSS]